MGSDGSLDCQNSEQYLGTRMIGTVEQHKDCLQVTGRARLKVATRAYKEYYVGNTVP